MLQPGRFDVMIYLGVADDKETRCRILTAQTRKMRLSCEIEEIEEIMPKGYTGADVFNYVSSAFKKAMVEKKDSIREHVKESMGVEELNRNDIRDFMRKDQQENFMEIIVGLDHFK